MVGEKTRSPARHWVSRLPYGYESGMKMDLIGWNVKFATYGVAGIQTITAMNGLGGKRSRLYLFIYLLF